MESDLADFVARRRGELGITQQELADRAGLKRDVIASIEARKSKLPEPETRRKLAIGLGVSHERLLVAAGQLLPEEASRPIEPWPFRPDSGSHAVLTMLDRMSEDEARTLAEIAKMLLDLRRPKTLSAEPRQLLAAI